MEYDNETKMASMALILEINSVEGFDPTQFLREAVNPDTGENELDIPLRARIAWFRLKYPDGRLPVSVTENTTGFRACARVYKDYKDPVDCFLSEADSYHLVETDDVGGRAARKEAQSSALNSALKLAGFGIMFDSNNKTGLDANNAEPTQATKPKSTAKKSAPASKPETQNNVDTALNKALEMPCPLTRHQGMTLGDLITADPRALSWLAKRKDGNEEVNKAAKLICDYALTQTA